MEARKTGPEVESPADRLQPGSAGWIGTLATTLLDEHHCSVNDLADLCRLRRETETNLGQLHHLTLEKLAERCLRFPMAKA